MSTIHLHKDVLRHIGKSHVYARARQYADANGLLEKTVIDDNLKCETFRLPDGSSWAFIEPVTNEEHEAKLSEREQESDRHEALQTIAAFREWLEKDN